MVGGTGDLSYSVALLRNLGGELAALADALDAGPRLARYDSAEMNHRGVSRALEDFADSWDDRRELLTRSLRSLADMATGSADTFSEVDAELASKVQTILADAP